jgi:hypothetical protein
MGDSEKSFKFHRLESIGEINVKIAIQLHLLRLNLGLCRKY